MPWGRIFKRSFHSTVARRAQSTASELPPSLDPNNSEYGGGSLLRRLLQKAYVVDARFSWKMLPFVIPTVVMSSLWAITQFVDAPSLKNTLERHFVLNLQNIQEGRYHTFITSAFGGHGSVIGSGYAELVTMLLFGGNLLRSHGLKCILGLWFFGHFVVSGITLYTNYQYYLQVQSYAKEPRQTDIYSPRQDRRRMVLAIERQFKSSLNPKTIKNAEISQREILRMPEPEFLGAAQRYYAERKAIPVGGGLLVLALGLRLNYLSFLPAPFVPVPTFIFGSLQAVLCLNQFTEYTWDERLIAISPLAFIPIAAAFLLPEVSYAQKALPGRLVDSLNLPKWIPRVEYHHSTSAAQKAKKVAEDAVRISKAMNLPTQVSSQQMEIMRKRNAKMQLKNKK